MKKTGYVATVKYHTALVAEVVKNRGFRNNLTQAMDPLIPDFRTAPKDRLQEWIARCPEALRALLIGTYPADLEAKHFRRFAVAMGATVTHKGNLNFPAQFGVDGDTVTMVYGRLGHTVTKINLWDLRLALIRHGIEL